LFWHSLPFVAIFVILISSTHNQYGKGSNSKPGLINPSLLFTVYRVIIEWTGHYVYSEYRYSNGFYHGKDATTNSYYCNVIRNRSVQYCFTPFLLHVLLPAIKLLHQTIQHKFCVASATLRGIPKIIISQKSILKHSNTTLYKTPALKPIETNLLIAITHLRIWRSGCLPHMGGRVNMIERSEPYSPCAVGSQSVVINNRQHVRLN
jgi:hypothetical protein